MNIFASLLKKTPPDILYHYTSQDGLLGIIGAGEIWATKIHYLNDASEFQLALKIARTELHEIKNDSNTDEERVRLDVLLEQIDYIEQINACNVCVCSFSKDGDSLSQWRGYCKQNAGYSIGFSKETLQKITAKNEFFLAPCVYDEKIHKELVRELIDEKLKEDFPTGGWKAHPTEPRHFITLPVDHLFGLKLTTLAPILKDKSFNKEQEWRLISKDILINRQKLEYRPGLSMITPFFKLPITINGKIEGIKEIIVGPTPHKDLSVMSVNLFLSSNGLLKNTNVKATTIPYINW